MSNNDNTVLHEIQSLEKQLDRLVPTLETFNSRISTIEADVKNLTGWLKNLKCASNEKKIQEIEVELKTKTITLQKDIESLLKDVSELTDASHSSQKESNEEIKAENKALYSRLWTIAEKIIGPLIGGALVYYLMGVEHL